MKNFGIMKYLISLFSALLLLASCNYLDFEPDEEKTEDFIYTYMEEAQKPVNYLYSLLKDDYAAIGGAAMREAATDNAVFTRNASPVFDYFNGSWSPTNLVDNVWPEMYNGIRNANLFLRNFDLARFDRFQYNKDYKDLLPEMELLPYQARFLRAWFYFELAKRYRQVPLVTEPLKAKEVNSLLPASFDDVIDFIVKECDAAAEELPVDYSRLYSKETGRVTKGACLALKARALLYAASPLFSEGREVEARYARAARAANDVICMEDRPYEIVPEPIWGGGNANLKAKQLIFERRSVGGSHNFEVNNTATGFESGKSGNCPTQNLVEAYGKAADPRYEWKPEDPYAGLDPRFEETVLHNGSKWRVFTGSWEELTIETFYNGLNGQPKADATKTGYYLKKHLNPDVKIKDGNFSNAPHHYPLLRYAEVLLNYAEALNLWKGPDYKDAEFTLSPVEAVNQVRVRSGAPALSGAFTIAEFNEIVRNERRVELCFEDHRFWDIRRWKIGPETATVYGVKILRDEATGRLTYSKEVVEDRKWESKMYFYPIPYAEIMKNPNLVQNPGW